MTKTVEDLKKEIATLRRDVDRAEKNLMDELCKRLHLNGKVVSGVFGSSVRADHEVTNLFPLGLGIGNLTVVGYAVQGRSGIILGDLLGDEIRGLWLSPSWTQKENMKRVSLQEAEELLCPK